MALGHAVFTAQLKEVSFAMAGPYMNDVCPQRLGGGHGGSRSVAVVAGGMQW